MVTKLQREFIDFLVEERALKFGDFTLKSGRKSPFFVNLGDLFFGYQLQQLAICYGNLIYKTYGKNGFDVLFGPAYKGIPLATAVAMYLWSEYSINVRYCANRKEVKDHGDVGALLGSKLKDGDRVLIIEDVTTSGKSIDEVMPLIMNQGNITVVGEVIAIDRCERADETTESAISVISQKYGFPVTPIVTMNQVIEYLYGEKSKNNVITEDIYQRLQQYYQEYGVGIS